MIGTAFFPLLTALRRKKISVFLRASMEIPVWHSEVSPRSRPMILRLLTSFVLALSSARSIPETCVFPLGRNLSPTTRNRDCRCTIPSELKALQRHKSSTCLEECNQIIRIPVETNNVLGLTLSSLLGATTARTRRTSQATTNRQLLPMQNNPRIPRYISSKSSTSSKAPRILLSKKPCTRSWCDSESAA